MTTAEIIRLLALCAHIIFGFVAAVVISLRRKPATAIAWILTIVFIPILGAVAFFLVGFGRLPKARRDKQRKKDERRETRKREKEANPGSPGTPGEDPDIAGIVPGPQPLPED